MIPKECKRLAEVDFPIATVSKHSAREKAIRHGHPSTLHLWWARRPLAACRAVLLGLLLPDPCDKLCPKEFKTKARELLCKVLRKLGTSDKDLQEALLKFIGDFANWDLASNSTYLEVGRGLVKAAHPEDTPLVVDPFAGGGSIPLEALRLGCDAFASDLNPVACLILKVMLEDIPRHGPELAEELRRVGAEVKHAAEKELAQYYPVDNDGSRPIAYLWARTVRCESPSCGAEIPLVRSFWLCKKADRKRALRYSKDEPRRGPPHVEFEIYTPRADDSVQNSTVSRANATCPYCHIVLPAARVRAQLTAQRGGADVQFDEKGKRIGGALLLAVATLKDGAAGRQYRLAEERDYAAIKIAQKAVAKLPKGALPDEPLPWKHGHRSIGAPRIYGMRTWGDYFTARQKLALHVFAKSGAGVGGFAPHSAVRKLLALSISKLVELACANCRWEAVAECPRSIFTRHDLPANWDFAEGVTISESSGSFSQVLENMISNLSNIGANWRVGQTGLADACESPLPSDSASVWFTDPPYYDAVAYADLSDFFFVWLKRTLRNEPGLRDPFDESNPLVPKKAELTVTTAAAEDAEPKNKEFFETGMRSAFTEGRRVLNEDGIGCVVFAHKTTEGWEALLSGILRGGWVIMSSWPIATEMRHRFNARDVAALGSSVHLICRPRVGNPTGDWGEVSRELPGRVRSWMERLEGEGVRGADLVFACIGPALEIYSRYAKVVDAEDRVIPLGGDPEAKEPYKRGYLAYVWETVGRIALEQVLGTAEARAQNGGAGALEEDARLTALFLWTLQATNQDSTAEDIADTEEGEEADEDEESPKNRKPKGLSLVFDVVRRFAQPLGIHLPDWESRIIETDKGVVRLLPIEERAEQLFGADGAQAIASRLEREAQGDAQMVLFPDRQEADAPVVRGRRGGRAASSGQEAPRAERAATTLDRVHAAMLLQAGGKSNALRAMLQAEHERSPDFLRLANSLSALYPKDSEEKRLLDAMLLAMPR